jgi:quercetin dioxygenase-like cupin family protein
MSGFHAIHVHNSEHYTWGEMCDGWHLVKDDRLSVIEEEMPPQAAEHRHFHRQSQQFFYVLDGKLSWRSKGSGCSCYAAKESTFLRRLAIK